MTLKFHGGDGSGKAASWITAIAPTSDELATLTELGFRSEILGHALDPDERPRLKAGEDTAFVVLRAPWFDGADASPPYKTIPLGIVLAPTSGVTICDRETKLVERLAAFADGELDHDFQQRMLLHALELVAEAFLADLAHINSSVEDVESRLQRSLENSEVLALLEYQKSLVHFTAALDATYSMLERAQKTPSLRRDAADDEWLEDVLAEYRQAIYVSTLARNVLAEMMDAFASIISNNLNRVMKFLASVTVILTIPVLIASFYGMNVALPGQHSPLGFAGTILASIVVGLAVTIYFRQRKWL